MEMKELFMNSKQWISKEKPTANLKLMGKEITVF